MERTAEVERLAEHGCSVLCLDCPEGMLFGIDYSAWSIGPRFMGVKLVPPGLHFVYCSASSEDVGVGRTGFFLFMKPREVAVFRWDREAEELVRPDSSEEEARYADGVRGHDFDANLGPYPLQLAPQWAELTRHADAQLLAKVEPVSGAVRSKRAEYDARGPARALEALEAKEAEEEAAFAPEENEMDTDDHDEAEGGERRQRKQQRQPPEGGEAPAAGAATVAPLESNTGGLFFSSLQRPRKRRGKTPEETTQLHHDRSGQLEELIAREHGGRELAVLGELQLAYVAFLLGQNFDGFEQWRALLQLLCSCEAASVARPELFSELLRTFFAQLSQAPSDLFGDDLTRDNFLGGCAVQLLELCDAEAAPAKLRRRCGKLRELVQEKFGLSSSDLALLGEDAPQIVEEDGADLVRWGEGPALTDMD